MISFLGVLAIFMIPVIFQCYTYAMSREGYERQTVCQQLGIVFVSVGGASLLTHDLVATLFGFLLIMLGLLLIGKGLDRKDKTIYIDRLDHE
jgi:drug/metabolite transporter (DMT)-like permease